MDGVKRSINIHEAHMHVCRKQNMHTRTYTHSYTRAHTRTHAQPPHI